MSAERRYVMSMDSKRCVGCHACVLACKAENDVPDGFCRDWIVEEVRGRFPDLSAEIRSERCNQCDMPPCVYCCPTGASWIADGGVVLVTANKCTGCKACIASCPYDARYVHPKGHVEKCTFCLHRVREDKDPACVEVCPTNALTFGDAKDPRAPVVQLLSKRRHKVLHPESGTGPHVYFME